MSSDIAVKLENIGKCYHVYDKPANRLLQMLVRGHRQYYREFWALKNISVEIEKGESVGIVGRNGSGKSTLLQIICGILNPTNGDVHAYGRIAALLELGSGFNPEFTGRENIYMNGAVLGLETDYIEARFEEIVQFADIGDFIEQPVKTYSSGMVVRLAFAVSVCVEPDILVIDEALAVGDAAFQYKCLDRMKQLTQSGTTLIFVSHDMTMVQSFCQKAIYLEKGCMKAQGTPDHIAELYFLDIRNEQRKNSQGKLISLKKPINGGNLPSFGTEEGGITKAYFLPDKTETCVVKFGEKVRIAIAYEYESHLQGTAVSVYLQDRRMLDISGKYFFLQPASQMDNLASGQIEIEFVANVRPGAYFLTLRLESSRVGQTCLPIDKQPAALCFEVSHYEPDFLGTLDIGMKGFNFKS